VSNADVLTLFHSVTQQRQLAPLERVVTVSCSLYRRMTDVVTETANFQPTLSRQSQYLFTRTHLADWQLNII